MRKKIVLVAFLFFFIGVFFGAKMFGKPITQSENKDVKNAVSEIVPTQVELVSTVFPKKDLYQVIKVIDGDTVSVNINGKIETIRLIGIDAPESVDPRRPVQCFGKEASDKARQILIGKKVSLESDPTQGDKDKYQRLLRYVFLEDGTNFNKFMLESGFAHEYTYSTVYKYQAEFKAAEKQARENSRGLWADGACLIPAQELQKSQEPTQTINTVNSGSFSCSGKTSCGQMTSCEEALFT